MLLFLVVPSFRCGIFGSDLIAVPFIFRLSYFLGVGLLFLACVCLAVLFLVGVGSKLLVPVSSYELGQTARSPSFGIFASVLNLVYSHEFSSIFKWMTHYHFCNLGCLAKIGCFPISLC